MKKLLFIPVCYSFLFLFISCEEDFNPKTDFKEKYILSCIIRGDTTYQTATLSKSYSVPGFDPYENTNDPALDGADIRIWYKNEVYFFRDTSVIRSDTSRYNTPQKYYVCDNFVPQDQSQVEVRAILNTGKVLYAKTTLPRLISWDGGNSTNIIPAEGKDSASFSWIGISPLYWYQPRLLIVYDKKQGDIITKHKVEVPVKYSQVQGILKAKYTTPARIASINYHMSMLDSALASISEGDPVKSNYKIYGGLVELLIFDETLSKYYSSINAFTDDYTIRVDQSDFTNIEGGFGIFGSYVKQIRGVVFEENYIESFGYLFDSN